MDKNGIWYQFLLSIIRHFLSGIGLYLVGKGVISEEFLNKFVESAGAQIIAGLIAFIGALYLSYRNKVWEFLKTRIGLILPPTATINDVVQVAEKIEDKEAVAKGEVKAEDIAQLTRGKVR